MKLADHITRMPRAFSAQLGAEALADAGWAAGPVAELLRGTAGSSPFLKGVITREAAWLEGALEDVEGAVARIIADLTPEPPLSSDQLAIALRRAKGRIALLIALCDLSGAWALHEVTGTLTRFADLAVDLALKSAVAQEIRRGKLPGLVPGEADLATAGGMVALAMGKMGAGELNYSSDIDLICLFDETRFAPGDVPEARAGFVRATRRMTAMLSDLTGEGYVFRTDLRLRPDPSVTPVCLSMDAAERYYESLGRTWERAAFIKARAAAGDVVAGARFLDGLTPFVWRKHLDFAAIQDAHDMRLRIRAHKGLGGPITLPGHNMKLGRGGIREIEFFTQTRQLIAGGRDPELRMRGTVAGLARLAEKGWVTEDAAQRLSAHYVAHREVEHRVQMIGDAQTHDLPGTADGMARLAALMGCDQAALERDLTARLTEVHQLTEGFFAPDVQDEAVPDVPKAFSQSPLPQRWRSYACLRSERAQALWTRVEPEMLRRLAGTARPDEALAAFDGFLAGLPAGVQLFSLFEANPQLMDLLADIVGTSPDLARYLSRNAGVFDAVIAGDFFSPWPGETALLGMLEDQLSSEADYERRLDLARRWTKEWHFRIGVHLLRGLMTAQEAGQAYADLAGAVLAALWPVVQESFAAKHGPPPGRGAVVLGMGSLGSGRLHARSDLDVIVIYDAQGVDMSEGRRPLPARSYYARLTQALITAMTAPMAEGKLYDVDMRLRPSGNQGPVATSWQAFQTYQREEAWTWEHLALTRARVMAGPAGLAADVERFRLELLGRPRARDKVLGDVAAMRARLAAAKGGGGVWDAKLGPGRMMDIELLAQAVSLTSGVPQRRVAEALRASLDEASGVAHEGAQDRMRRLDPEPLVAAYELAWAVQIGTRLVSEKAFVPEAAPDAGVGTDVIQTRVGQADAAQAVVTQADVAPTDSAQTDSARADSTQTDAAQANAAQGRAAEMGAGQGACAFLLRLTEMSDLAALESALTRHSAAAAAIIDAVLPQGGQA